MQNSVAASAPCAIDIEGVSLSYGDHAVLSDINLHIAPGEFFGFLGPSGCGKTTLLRLIAGFNMANAGHVRIGGDDVSRLPPWQRDVGMVFQSYALWPHMSVARNVAFGLEERGMPRAEIRTRVAEALSLVGLEDYADRRPAQLSGGQQQRVALARTIVVRPKVLLLDEPLSNLDAKMREQVRRELRDLQQKLRLTTVFVTHDQEEANTTCDRVAVLKDGRVQQVGTPIDLYNRPANLFVANFLGTINSLEGKATADGLFAGPQGLRVPLPSGLASGNSLRAIFRPQSAEIQPSTAAAPAAGSADRAFLPATVQRQEFLGAILRYGLQAGDAAIVIDAPYHAGVPLHPVGSQVTVMVPHAAVQFLPA